MAITTASWKTPLPHSGSGHRKRCPQGRELLTATVVSWGTAGWSSLYISKGIFGDVFQRPLPPEGSMLPCGDEVSKTAAQALSPLTYSKLCHERDLCSIGKHNVCQTLVWKEAVNTKGYKKKLNF